MSPHAAWMVVSAAIAVAVSLVIVDTFWPFDVLGRRREINLQVRDRDWWDD